MNNTKIILDGYKIGDKNGGPTELAKILSNSLLACNGFNKNDLVKRYHHCGIQMLLTQDQHLQWYFKNYLKVFL